jgi:hypothetical protein
MQATLWMRGFIKRGKKAGIAMPVDPIVFTTLSNLDGLMSWSCLGINTVSASSIIKTERCTVFLYRRPWPPNTISIYQ